MAEEERKTEAASTKAEEARRWVVPGPNPASHAAKAGWEATAPGARWTATVMAEPLAGAGRGWAAAERR